MAVCKKQCFPKRKRRDEHLFMKKIKDLWF